MNFGSKLTTCASKCMRVTVTIFYLKYVLYRRVCMCVCVGGETGICAQFYMT